MHLFAVHHLMVEEEKHSLLALDLRLRHLSHLPRKDEMGAPAENVFTLHGSKHKDKQLLPSPVAVAWTIMKQMSILKQRLHSQHLPVLYGALPSDDFVNVLKAPFSLIDQSGHILHGI